jgi:hypothetical protein
MFTHPDTAVELVTMRHLEVLAKYEQARRGVQVTASRPQRPGILSETRIWFSLIWFDIGTRLQSIAEPGRPADAFSKPAKDAGVSVKCSCFR